MTRINHERPFLKYVSNLSREIDRDYRKLLNSASFEPPRAPNAKRQPRRLSLPKNEASYEKVMLSSEQLSEGAKLALASLLDAAQIHLDAQLILFESVKSLSNSKKKAAASEAYSRLRNAAESFNLFCNQERRDGKSPLREWFGKLRVSMGSEWAPFEDIDSLIQQTRT